VQRRTLIPASNKQKTIDITQQVKQQHFPQIIDTFLLFVAVPWDVQHLEQHRSTIFLQALGKEEVRVTLGPYLAS
jgi:hypothetical protein